jgi:hypothetical protein
MQGSRQESRHRSDRHDTSATTPDHRSRKGATREIGTAKIGGDHAIPDFRCQSVRIERGLQDARTGDQHFDRTNIGLYCRGAAFDGCFIQNVDLDKRGSDLVYRLLAAFDVDVGNHHPRASLAKALGAGESDTASASRNNSDPTGE